MEYYKKMLCVTFAELTGGDDPIIKDCTLRQNVKRKNIICAHRGGGEGSTALYTWNSIPDKYRQRFVARYGDPEERIKEAMTRSTITMDDEAREFYEGFTYTDKNGEVKHLTDKLRDEYVTNASVLKELVKLMRARKALRKSLNGSSMKGAWEVIARSSEALRESYGHTLPANADRLKVKIKAFEKEGYSALISGKLGNSNTVKITPEFGRVLISLKRSRVPVYTDAQLFARGNEIAGERGWKPLRSLSGLKRWLNSSEIAPLWWDAVFGEQSARQKFGRKHRTALPLRRDTLWYGDGTKLNLYYRDEQGSVRTTQVYEVIDAMSEVMLGYHISDREDFEAQYHAYRMAIQTSGYKPYEIVHDNQGGHKKLNKKAGKDEHGFLDKLCQVHRATMPYNGESKTIEHVFGRFQAQVLHQDWRFTGQNVTAVKESSRPNIEYVEANKDKLYTLAELKDAYAAARKMWNEMPHPVTGERRIDMYERSVNEALQKVTPYDMVDMFWLFTQKPVTFTDSGIQITVKGRKYPYEVFSSPGVPDHDWRMKNTYKQFIVAYDPYDMTSVRLYEKEPDGSLRFNTVAGPYIVIPRAIQDQQEGDAKFIRQEQAANLEDRISRLVAGKEIEYEHGVAPEQHGMKTPRLKGTNAEVQREIDRRLARYRKDPEEFQLGRVSKLVSLDDWWNHRDGKDENKVPVIGMTPKVSHRKIAGKM